MSHELTHMRNVLWQHLLDTGSSFSIGSYGAIAEFHRRDEEALELCDEESLSVASSRGGIRITIEPGARALAFETLSRRRGHWQHGVAFCLCEQAATLSRRRVVTELGADANALWPGHRCHFLFDLGLNARNVDFCVRTREPALLRALRAADGTNILDPGNPIMSTLLSENPHRVILSAMARAEVYQPIGRDTTPEGPHTHVLPKHLKSGRTHSANIPIPHGFRPCLTLHPANPLFDAMGTEKAFEAQTLEAFIQLLGSWGGLEYQREKRRLTNAFFKGASAESYTMPSTRVGRTALRVALRQLAFTAPDQSKLRCWEDRFDRR